MVFSIYPQPVQAEFEIISRPGHLRLFTFYQMSIIPPTLDNVDFFDNAGV